MVFASEGACVSTENNAHNVVNAMGAKSVSTANDAHTVVSAVGARSVNMANNAHFVSVAAALCIANTRGLPARANYARSAMYVVP